MHYGGYSVPRLVPWSVAMSLAPAPPGPVRVPPAWAVLAVWLVLLISVAALLATLP